MNTGSHMPQSIIERVEKLRKLIEHHRYNYHVLNKEEITEAALDSLKNELVSIESTYPELIVPTSPTQRVAGAPLPFFTKITHTVRQWSFNDAFSTTDIEEFDARVKKILKKELQKDVAVSYTCELKIDGLKIVLTYKDGFLLNAATRGDGIVGEDVTLNIKTIESIPLSLAEPIDCTVEGEVYMPISMFNKINQEQKKMGFEEYANPRNIVAGTIRQLDSKIVQKRKPNMFVYDITGGITESVTQYEELHDLQKLGFRINMHSKQVQTLSEIIDYWKFWQVQKEKEDYLIDGIVIKVDKKEYQDILGYTGKSPRFGIAFKFPAEQTTTIVTNIVLQIGRTGVLTPVAELVPVAVAGSVVSRATLHNVDEISRLDVRIGDTVVIQKAGDVIPDIVQVLFEMRNGKEKKYIFPKNVPECGDDGEIEQLAGQVAYRCKNKNSYAQHKQKLYYFVSKHGFDIENCGPKVIDVLLEYGLISHAYDLFKLKAEEVALLPRMGEISAQKLITSISQKKEIDLARFLVALSIPQVGSETAYDIAKYFKTLDSIRNQTEDTFSAIEGIGEVVSKSIYTFFNDDFNREYVDTLLSFVTVLPFKKVTQATLQDKKFVLTGTLQTLSREEAKQLILERGGTVSSSVSTKTNYVVYGENPGSKYTDAENAGVLRISEKDFLALIS